MRILLVEPPFYSFMEYDRWYYPHALGQLAAIAHAAGHDVRIYDGDKYFPKDPATRERAAFSRKHALYHDHVDDPDYFIWKHFREALAAFRPEAVGISVYTCKWKAVWKALAIVRAFDPAIRTCVGGAHVTGAPDDFIGHPDVDGVFLGYADATFPAWLADGCPRGAWTGDLRSIDLATVPHARREALLHPECFSPRDLGLLSTSRGCPGSCAFCSVFMCDRRMKFRTADQVRAELAEITGKWGVRHTVVTDASCTDFPEYFRMVADLYAEFGVAWETEGRWATITRELLEHFRARGCDYFNVGLESGSDRILAYIRKGCTKRTIREKSRLLNEVGLRWKLCCMVGFPEETLDDMKETLDLALEIDPLNISLNSFCPLPGTELYAAVPGITPAIAASVSQVAPNRCFSRHVDLETYQATFLEMTRIFDEHNRRKQGGLRDSCGGQSHGTPTDRAVSCQDDHAEAVGPKGDR